MRDGIGSIFLYNIIIVFILLVFAFLAAIMSYNKAFKINSRIVGIIEKYEGYNALAVAEIDQDLTSIGYRRSGEGMTNCAERPGGDLQDDNTSNDGTYAYCIYFFDPNVTGHNHYRYGVTSFISFDFPFVDVVFKLPIYAETDSMYNFSFGGN